jgi:hypothetical protein
MIKKVIMFMIIAAVRTSSEQLSKETWCPARDFA